MPHPTAADLADYAAGKLPAERRADCEEHLSRCAECRLHAVSRFLAGRERATVSSRWRLSRRARAAALRLSQATVRQPPGSLRQARPSLAALALLGAVGIGIYFYATRQPNAAPAALRENVMQLASPQLLAPLPAAALGRGAIAFAWKPLTETTSYRVIVLDREGDPVAELETVATALTWRASDAVLTAGEDYYWYVVAQLVDGTERDSEIRRFQWLGTEG